MAEGSLILTRPASAEPVELAWPPELFSYDMREAERRERVQGMDVAGRARALVWGPYKRLAAGRWQATARFTVDRHSCRHTYRLEWGASRKYATYEFRPGRAGIFEVSAEHSLAAPIETELRIILTEGSLGGHFEFQGARVRRLAAASPDL